MRVERKSSGAWEKRILSTLNYKLSILLVFLALAQGLAAEENSSLSESKIENVDTKVTATAMLSQNEELRKQLSLARESVKTLTDSLAASNMESEVFRRKYSDLQLRMEALGLESANKDRAKLEQRLLSAVSDLRLMQKEREKYRDQVLGLSEAIMHLLKTSTGGDALARMEVEAQLRSSSELAMKSQNSSASSGSRRACLSGATTFEAARSRSDCGCPISKIRFISPIVICATTACFVCAFAHPCISANMRRPCPCR